jgi:hypothetical protein
MAARVGIFTPAEYLTSPNLSNCLFVREIAAKLPSACLLDEFKNDITLETMATATSARVTVISRKQSSTARPF